MDDVVRIFGPRAHSTLAEEFHRLLSVCSGQTVYGASIEHSRGLAWKLAVVTEEGLAASAGKDDADDADDLSPSAKDALDPAAVRHRRWYPPEWPVSRVRPSPQWGDFLDDLEVWKADGSNVRGLDWFASRSAFVALAVDALASDDVRAVFTEAGAAPVVVVFEPGGPVESVVESFDRLNAEHPDPEQVADARLFWTSTGTA